MKKSFVQGEFFQLRFSIAVAHFHIILTAMGKIGAGFFERDPVLCAKELIGSILTWKGCTGKIVETEGYSAIGDEACHTWFRPSSRKFVEDHQAGDAYVYVNYGVHWLFNILVKGAGGTGFVLIRALEPLAGIEEMRLRRGGMKDRLLAAGPGRLTQAMGISARDHGKSFLEADDCGISLGEAGIVIAGPRIGISKAAELPWRFGEADSRYLSRGFAKRP